MAIHPYLPGLSVSIDVAGQDLPEYNDEDQDEANPMECVKYIEAVSGAEFGFATRFDTNTFPHANKNIVLHNNLDGQIVGQCSFDPEQMRGFGQDGRLVVRGAITGSNQGLITQPMLFSELKICEEAPDKALMGKLGNLGTITVGCYLARLEPQEPIESQRPLGRKARRRNVKNVNTTPDETTTFKPLLADGRIPEKNLKGMALSHQAVVGPPTPFQRPSFRAIRQGPALATFVFKYRSRAALQALHIIPRTPSPVPLEDRPVEELSMEDMRELLRRQRASRNAQPGRGAKQGIKQEIKRERDLPSSEGEESDIEVVEHCNKRIRADSGRGNAGAVIDLCDD
ncbi:hypothetical protein LTR10_010327 [Elasticomyces elasticus]|nr:hypothetical protein LTR10_010327 [Elasticomyces elasticus]KAK4972231.1 hypothetical protein LTR42_006737 [Elasticomyces elasticus]